MHEASSKVKVMKTPNMKMQLLFGSVICLASFIGYGMGRTMSESFGLSTRGTILGCTIAIFAISPIALVLFILFAIQRIQRFSMIITKVIIVCSLGCFISEIHIMVDESDFVDEVVAMDQREIYSRARVWPNSTAGLVYANDRGFSATD